MTVANDHPRKREGCEFEKCKRTKLSIADKVKILDRLKKGFKKEDIMTDFQIVQ